MYYVNDLVNTINDLSEILHLIKKILLFHANNACGFELTYQA